MLFVMVGVGPDRYAIPACDIVEIASGISGTTIQGTARTIAGLIEYRGRAIPLLDLGQLCHGVTPVEAPTTRILIVRREGDGGLVGIRAERVTSTVRMESGAFEALSAAPPYITGVAFAGDTIVQRIDLHRLLGENIAELATGRGAK